MIGDFSMILALRLLSVALTYLLPALAFAQAPASPEIIHNSGHSTTIHSIVYAPNGRWFATGSDDSTVKLWDAISGRLLRTLAGHSKRLQNILISSDGRALISLGEEGAIVWNPETGEVISRIGGLTGTGFEPIQKSIALSRDGKTFFSNSYDAIRRVDVSTGKVEAKFGRQILFGLWEEFALSPDERLIAAAHAGGVNASPKNAALGSQVKLIDATTGKTVRALGTYSTQERVTSLAFSQDGRTVAVGGNEGVAKVWDVASGRLLHTLAHSESTQTRSIDQVLFSPDSRMIVTAGGPEGLKFWDASSGRLIRVSNEEPFKWSRSVAFSPDGRVVASTSSQTISLSDAGNGKRLPVEIGRQDAYSVAVAPIGADRWLVVGPRGITTWDAVTWQMLQAYEAKPGSAAYSEQFFATDRGGRLLLATNAGDLEMKIWDVGAGALLRAQNWGAKPPGEGPCATCASFHLEEVTLSPDGRWLAAIMWGDHTVIRVWDVASGRLVHSLKSLAQPYRAANMMRFSADSRFLIASSYDANTANWIRYWNMESGQQTRAFPLPKTKAGYAESGNFTFSPDGRSFAIQFLAINPNNDNDDTVAIVDATNGRTIRFFPATKFKNSPSIIRFSPDGQRVFVGLSGGTQVNVWDVASGTLIRSLEGNPGAAVSLAFSPDGRRLVVGNGNGTSSVWDVATLERLAITLHDASGEWVTITPEGFFTASANGAGLLHVVRNFETVGIDQVYQSLYRPDLVREKLAGDPRGLVREAAVQLDLAKVLATGNAPLVSLVSPRGDEHAAGRQIDAEIEIAVRDGGIGRVEWRVNGITVALDAAPAGQPAGSQTVRLRRSLAIEEGDNAIEVVAYNGANLIASVPARARVTLEPTAPSSSAAALAPLPAVKPRLFVLAAGVNEYADRRFKLEKAVWDAQEVARGFRESSGDLYQSVEVKLLIDVEVTRARLDDAFGEIAAKAAASDVFVLYLAGHGKTVDGRYYFVPQDFTIDGELSEQSINAAVKAKAVSQEQWQRWFSQVPARKSVMLFDTCESGTLADDETQQLQKGAANDRLVQATGRSILAASGGSQEALEGYRGHGLFTYEVLDAINDADGDRNGTIELNELAAYVYAQVSEVSQKVFKQRQVPQMKLTSNYPLAKQMRILKDETAPVAAAKPTYQVSQAAPLQVQPGPGATVVRSLSAKTDVTVLESKNGWSLIASEGKPIGYVATKDLSPMQ